MKRRNHCQPASNSCRFLFLARKEKKESKAIRGRKAYRVFKAFKAKKEIRGIKATPVRRQTGMQQAGRLKF
jgi:hypothetical protein